MNGKLLKSLLCALALMVFSPSANAIIEKKEINLVIYNLENDGTVSAGSYYKRYLSGSVTILSEVEFSDGITRPVTYIRENGFYDCSLITEIIMPNTIEEIWAYAFGRCTALENITFSTNLRTIGQGAFESTNIKDVVLPNSLTSIGQYAFRYWAGETFKYPDSMTELPSEVLYDCSNVTSITLPANLQTIKSNAIDNCPNVTSLHIPESVTTIEYKPCPHLGITSIDDMPLPSSFTVIPSGFYAFQENLTSVVIPGRFTEIGISAFQGCSALTEIVIPNTVTKINENAFSWCSALESIEIPASVRELPNSLFYQCTHLKSVTLPNTIKTLPQYLFRNCTALTEFEIPASITKIDDYCFKESCLTTITIPSTVRTFGKQIFSSCKQLTSVTLPETLTEVPYSMFSNCTNLTNIDLPESCTSIADYAFAESGLKSLKLPKNCATIGKGAFNITSSLEEISIPAACTSIGNQAFYYTTALKKIKCRAAVPPAALSQTFTGSTATVYVYPESVADYEAASYWNTLSIQPFAVTALSDATDYEAAAATDCDMLSYTRTYNHDKWQPLYIPFAMNYEDWKDNYEVARINNFHQYDEDDNGTPDRTELEIIKIKSGSIQPNTPYLIKSLNTGEQTLRLEEVSLEAADESSYDLTSWTTRYIFTGTYHTVPGSTMLANGYYGMADGTLKQAESSEASLSPYRWYLHLESRTPAPFHAPKRIGLRMLDEDGTLTGIEELDLTDTSDAPADVYDLNGRLIAKRAASLTGLPKGIYIVNGKKVIK